MTNIHNPILNTDSYKLSHWNQYPPGTEYVHAYIESRGGVFDRTLFFGLQMWIEEYMKKPITKENIDEAEEIALAHGEPFNREGWEYILYYHKGLFPIEIWAVPEGTVVNNHNVLATIVNSDPKCFWLPSYLETQILRAIWYPSTVATISWHCKKIIKESITKSSDDPDQINFKLHDFGARGVSSFESAGIGGVAHLVNFMGTDTVSGLLYARKYYGASMAGFSIPAAEHSTITSWGKNREVDAYRNMLKHYAKKGKILAVVSDSYDLWNAVENIWGKELKQEVIDSGALLVVRPDSGDPLTVPLKVIEKLGETYGFTTNSKGYKVLNTVRVIQGDGITVDSLPIIIKNILDAGWAIDNIAFGMGGGLLQHCNRDTLKFAMKTSRVVVNGGAYDVWKDPVTDPGKASKRGLFSLIQDEPGQFRTVQYDPQFDDFLEPAEDRYQSFDEVRALANSYLT